MTANDPLGRPLNPDTGLPYPSASQAQLELVEEVIVRLDGQIDASSEDWTLIHDALVEVAVRQHGRTARALRDDLRVEADRLAARAAALVEEATEGPVLDAAKLAEASRLVGAAWSVRSAVLRGDRA